MQKTAKSYGFSLTELLVVIVSIMILSGITLASLSRAKEYARVTECLSNLHQLSLAATAYAVNSRGALPSDDNTPDGYWYPELARYDTDIAANALCPDAMPPSGGIGTASLAWGVVNMSAQPHPPGYPWAVGTTSSYGLNNYVDPGNNISGISSFGFVNLSGNQTFHGDVASASGIVANGNVSVYGNLTAGGNITANGNVYISGSQIPNMPGIQPPSVSEIFQQIQTSDNPTTVTSPQVLDFTQNPYQIINGNFSPSGQIQIIGSGTLLVSGDVTISGHFPANGSGTASINLVVLGNINMSGQTNINGGLYAGQGISIRGKYNLSGVMVADGAFNNNGRGTYVQGAPPAFDPRVQNGNLLASQPLFADAIWVDGSPLSPDPVPANLQYGNSTLSSKDDMGIFCINRHIGQVNVSFTDGSAHTVPLAQLWQLRWSSTFTPKNVTIPMSW